MSYCSAIVNFSYHSMKESTLTEYPVPPTETNSMDRKATYASDHKTLKHQIMSSIIVSEPHSMPQVAEITFRNGILKYEGNATQPRT